MAINVIDNFSYRGKKPNFERDSFDTLSAMKSFPETDIDEGHISFCKEDGKHYKFSSANEVDPTTGKWRENNTGVSDAPSDGKTYGRKDGAWAEVESGSADAVLYTPQELTEDEQKQVRKNIDAAQNYYNKNGFVLSPLGMSALNLRYIGFKEVKNSNICYLLTSNRCLKMDFETYEVFWDVVVPGSTSAWHRAGECLRVIDNIVYIIIANYNTKGLVLVQLNDEDGTTIQSVDVPIKVNYIYDSFRTKGSPLITKDKIYAVDRVDKKIMSFDLNTLEPAIIKDNVPLIELAYSSQQLLWINKENGEAEFVMIVFYENTICVVREDGSTIDIKIEQGYQKGRWVIYQLNLQSLNISYLLNHSVFIGKITDNGDGTYSANFAARKKGLLLRWQDQFSNSPYQISPTASLSIIDPLNSIVEHLMTPTSKGAYFHSFNAMSLLADNIFTSESSICNIKKILV